MSLTLITDQSDKILVTDDNKAFEAPALAGAAGNYLMAKKNGETLEKLYDNGEEGAARRVYYFVKS